MDKTRVIFIAIIAAALLIGAGAFFIQQQTEPINGLSGSEKIPFLQDERVQAVLKKNNLDLTVTKAGSRKISSLFNQNEYVYAFPAGVPAAEKIKQDHNIRKTYSPFFSPMVVFSWKPVADLLVANEVATNKGSYYELDMAKMIILMENETRWEELAKADQFYASPREVLIRTTNPTSSNSGAMYLGLISYVANQNQVVSSDNDARTMAQRLLPLFARQGFQAGSSQEPFNDYLSKGMGHSPIVFGYEQQFIAQMVSNPASIQSEMVLMYPTPTLYTKHTLVAANDQAEQLGLLLETDAELQGLAAEYGLRPEQNITVFNQLVNEKGVNVPLDLINIIDPPTFETMEAMITYIEREMQ